MFHFIRLPRLFCQLVMRIDFLSSSCACCFSFLPPCICYMSLSAGVRYLPLAFSPGGCCASWVVRRGTSTTMAIFLVAFFLPSMWLLASGAYICSCWYVCYRKFRTLYERIYRSGLSNLPSISIFLVGLKRETNSEAKY